MKSTALMVVGTFLLLAAGCEPAAKSARGFRLPDGDIKKGKAAFTALKCHACHTVDGVELPPPEKPARVTVALGGEAVNVKTYGDLVTSIIDPSHKLALAYKKESVSQDEKSLMADCNEAMTVRQMIDLVAFLQSRYKKLDFEAWRYQ